MNKEEIEKIIPDLIKEGFLNVINSEEDYVEWSFNYASIHHGVKILQELGFAGQNMQSNGWEADYWETYIKGDQKVCISGSGFYGGLTITKEDE